MPSRSFESDVSPLDRWALPLLLVGLFTGCAQPDESVPADTPAPALLRHRFPDHAHLVLRAPADTFVEDEEAVRLRPGAWSAPEVDFPRDTSAALRFRLSDGFEVHVREAGLQGEASLAEGAVAYPRAGGTSFWTAGEGGVEEWLLLDAGETDDSDPVAEWDISGATLRKRGDVVELADDTGRARLFVTAPTAFTRDGDAVRVTLSVEENQLRLHADARGRAVLVDPVWTTVPPMSAVRVIAAASRMSNGKVLVSGGYAAPQTWLSSAEVYDPSSNSWTPTPPMSESRWLHVSVALNNGKVLVSDSSAQVYDPATNTWSAQISIPSHHYGCGVLLQSGKVLLAGASTAAHTFDPSNNTWANAGSLSVGRFEAAAARLPSGKVIVAGGYQYPNIHSSTDVYDPATNTWSAGPNMVVSRRGHTATTLTDGRVLVTGGWAAIDGQPQSTAEVYDPATNAWALVAPMPIVRAEHSATLLPNGRVLVTGSFDIAGNASVYDPVANTWAAAGDMGGGRYDHTATLLQNGSVLLAGGQRIDDVYLSSTSLYAPSAIGAACSGSGECDTNLCVDGVCCGSACTGTCMACSAAKKGGGANGTCGPVAGATDPDNDCSAQSASTCGTNGLCDGAGACQKHALNTVCAAASCSGSVLYKADLCNGTGSCNDAGTQQCSPYNCSNGACLASCSTDAHCATSAFCNISACEPKKVTGAPCGAANQCSSGICADGVCCTTACGGACQACSAAKKGGGTNGTCGSVAVGTDPDNECAAQAASSCGTNGVCDGAGACQKHASNTVCAAASCSGSVLYKADLCNGAGTCTDAGAQDCAPHACAGGACLAACSNDTQCASNAYCDAGSCTFKKPVAAACTAANQCQSSFCADGVCCDTACQGSPCEACSAAKKGGGADGKCEDVSAGLDPDGECEDQGAASCANDGVCDGAGACQKYAAGTVCAAAFCEGTTVSFADVCDGSGACLDSATGDCAPFACDSGACLPVCSDDGGCSASAFCDSTTCILKKPLGAACAGPNQCQSDFCADGVCCDTACDGGLCEACSAAKKGGGADGECDSVAAGTDPDEECDDAGPASCAENGACDGAGACQKYASGTPCQATICDGNTLSQKRVCDGDGVCVAGTSESCAPFACLGDACTTSCSAPSDCAPSAVCKGSICAPKADQGALCDDGSQCATGHCADGVCCDAACDGPCQACSAEAKGAGEDGQCGGVTQGVASAGDCQVAPPPGPQSYYGCSVGALPASGPRGGAGLLTGIVLLAATSLAERRRRLRGRITG